MADREYLVHGSRSLSICFLEVAQSNVSQLFLVSCQVATKACQKRSKWRRRRLFSDPLTEICKHCLSLQVSAKKYIAKVSYFLLPNVINLSGKYNYSVLSIFLSQRYALPIVKFCAQLLPHLNSVWMEKLRKWTKITPKIIYYFNKNIYYLFYFKNKIVNKILNISKIYIKSSVISLFFKTLCRKLIAF